MARRLRSAGINVAPSNNKHKRPGVYVTGRAEHVTVLVDLDKGEVETQEIVSAIVDIVISWGITPETTIAVHEAEAVGRVIFTYQVTPPKNTLGKPVHHTRTGKLVGYLTNGKFVPVEGEPK